MRVFCCCFWNSPFSHVDSDISPCHGMPTTIEVSAASQDILNCLRHSVPPTSAHIYGPVLT